MKTDAKTLLLSTVAAVSLVAGGAFAENHSAANTETDAQQMTSAEDGAFTLGDSYSTIGDTQVAELLGMQVRSENDESVGEIDNFVLMDGELKGVVGVGGFLGLGEHSVAISLSDMEYDPEEEVLILSKTREELEAMPEWTEELEQQRLAENETLNTYETPPPADASEIAADDSMESDADASEEMAGTQAEAGMTDDGQTEEMAENAEGEIEQEAEEIAAETEAAAEEASTEVAEAAESTENAVENAADEGAEMAENAAEETEQAVEDAGQTMAEAGEAAETAAEDAGTEVAEAAEATENAAEEVTAETAQEIANVDEATEAPEGGDTEMAAEGSTEVETEGEGTEMASDTSTETMTESDSTEMASDSGVMTWEEKLEGEFSELATMTVGDLEGINVVSPEGEKVGEVDDIGRIGDKLVAIVGVGGFLGLGEHDVSIELSQFGWQDGDFVAEGMTREDLEAMPEYNRESFTEIDEGQPLTEVN